MKIKYVEIIPFELEHALELDLREHEKKMQKTDEFRAWAEANLSLGPSFSGVVDGKVVGCGGVRILWNGVGEAWAIFSKDIIKYPKEAYYYINKFLHIIIKDQNLHRVQAYVRTDVNIAVKYIENLGFKRESMMKKFSYDKKDYYMYVLLKE